MVLFRFVLALALLFSSSLVSADPDGLFLSEGLIGYTLSFNQSPTAVVSRTLASSQTGLGYVFGGWAYVGGLFDYSLIWETTSDSSNNTTSHQESYEYYGPSFGYINDNWVFILDWLAYTEQKDNVSSPSGGYTTDRTGSGFGFDIGYRWNFGSFELGPLLSLKSITYNNCRDPNSGATSSCSPTITQFEVTPYVHLLFNFK